MNSLEKQTFQNWEGIIVNDGSTDGTEEIALEYVKKDEEVQICSFRKGGVSKARNIELTSVRYLYFTFRCGRKLEETYIEKGLSAFYSSSGNIVGVLSMGLFWGSD